MKPQTKKPGRSLRREVSLVLLLSSLTAIVLAASGAVLASVVGANRDGAAAARMVADVSENQSRLREAADELPDPLVDRFNKTLTDVAARLGEMDNDKAQAALRDLHDYRAAVEAYVLAPPAARAEGAIKDGLVSAHIALERSLVYLAHLERPTWLDPWVNALPWILFWVLITTAAGVWRAWRLQKDFSGPLEALAESSGKVGAGDLSVVMPPPSGVSEVIALREAIESMRARLVSTLAHVDASRDELQMILQHMSDGVALIDVQGQIREFNPAFRRHLEEAGGGGRIPDRGRPLTQVFPQVPHEMLRGLAPHDAEVGVGPEGGPPTIFRVRVNPMRDGTGRLFVIHDVTRERELEEMQRNFLSVVTHELKTPLTVVLGYNKLMLAGKAGPLSDKQSEFINLISKEASKLKGMIQDLLDIARIEGDNLPIEPRPRNVARLIRQTAVAQQALADDAGITLHTDADDVSGLICELDEVRFEQVLSNLIGNALKFTPAGGRITLRGKRKGDNAIVEVEDTGRGIPPKAIPQLFEKFFQVDKKDTRLAGGAGLGLYICRELVEAHGGEISVRSALGHGTTFTLRFPILSDSPGDSLEG